MTLSMLALCITAAIAIIQIFLSKEQKKLRYFLGLLTLIALGITYISTKDDDVENKKMKTTLTENKNLLEQANAGLANQSKIINEGFSNLTAQLNGSTTDNVRILTTVNNLNTQVRQFTDASRNYFKTSIELSKETLSNLKDDKGIFVNSGYVKIPAGERNSVSIDAINTFTVVDAKPEQLAVIVKINGHDNTFVPGGQFTLNMADGKPKVFVYNGQENGRLVFNMHD